MTIDKFMEIVVEGYLFKDLEAMTLIIPADGEYYGGVGYPMIMAILAGMEFLGGTTCDSDADFNDYSGHVYFLYYWDNYLVKTNETMYSGLAGIIYRLARHGIAHAYLSKQGILISKRTEEAVIKDFVQSQIIINPSLLFVDLEKSYKNYVLPVLNNPTHRMQKQRWARRLQSMLTLYDTTSKKEFKNLMTLGGNTASSSVSTSADVTSVTTATTVISASGIGGIELEEDHPLNKI